MALGVKNNHTLYCPKVCYNEIDHNTNGTKVDNHWNFVTYTSVLINVNGRVRKRQDKTMLENI